ncbi:M14 family zinc carboxypeptidase [Chiayiivirga flava]|uniref:Peptidase M14 domain-containing protein n=1 Tax=Chiayiivirga flava TaxID=659595 RepID=A0A7W8D2Q6_9GAMM|nr:hypothetical protein [Chiayiivirga flava]
MSARTRIAALGAALLAGPVAAQQIYTFTEAVGGPNTYVYGLPVPVPIDSLAPVDGFRSYAALEARLQALAFDSDDLSAHDIGRSSANRVQWAYVASDADGVDVEGRPEAAFFINATTHAREWAAPEVAAGTLERLVDGAGDRGIVRYVLDNTRVIVIPVHNVDGFLQSQRYPTQAIVGQDPDFPNDWPRDGRMRRKNMPGVDEVLTTFADHLGGTDLNRNHPPLWATSVGPGGSSADPRSLTYHGTAPHGEAENQSLVRAAELGPASRMRLGIDVHTFSKVFYSSNTGRTRLNSIQTALIDRLRSHHIQVSGGASYRNVPDPANQGIGAAAEYFAYQWLVPAWTLELEPSNSAAEYGGTNVTHSGFILPASEARRVREAWAETHLVAFYRMAGPAHLSRARFFEAGSGRLAQQLRWVWNPTTGQRALQRSGDAALVRGARYRVELAFSKPMRMRDTDGAVLPMAGATGAAPAVEVSLLDAAGTALGSVDTAAGTWLDDPARVLRYRDDTFAFEFDAPQTSGEVRFGVATRDYAAMALDADPATPADWADGAWTAYESAVGVAGDFGGTDRSTVAVTVADAAAAPLATVVSAPSVVGEGDAARIVLRRVGADLGGTVSVSATVAGAPFDGGVAWAPGEGGDKVFPVPMLDDAEDGGDRTIAITLLSSVAPQGGELPPATSIALPPLTVRLLDNDSGDLAVLRSHADGAGLSDALQRATGAGATAIVVDRGPTPQTLPARGDDAAPPSAWMVTDALSLYGNHGDFALPPSAGSPTALLQVGGEGALVLDAVHLDAGGDAQQPRRRLLDNAGLATLRRSSIEHGAQSIVASSGQLQLQQVLLRDLGGAPAAIATTAGRTVLRASTVTQVGHGSLLWSNASLDLQAASIVGNAPAPLLADGQGASLVSGHALLQDNRPDPDGSPPTASTACDGFTASSFGFNIDDGSACGLVAQSDRSGLALALGAFDPALGGHAPVGAAIDTGAAAGAPGALECGTVDQRGAPRPQTLTPGAVPRCDIGAIELGINPYRGIWAPARSGHGLDLQTSGNTLLLAWYTYADDGQPTAYQAAASLTGPRWQARLQWSRRDPDTGVVSVVDVGRVGIDFASDTRATLHWRFDARGTDGSEAIEASFFDAGTPRFEVTGLWFPPAEPNYGATITRRGETTALGLYYYDAGGTIRWALGSGTGADAQEFAMTSFTGFCPDCDATQMPVSGAAAGTVLAHFRTPELARLDVALTYPRAAGGTWNRMGVRFVPLNDAVDNRAAVGDAAR